MSYPQEKITWPNLKSFEFPPTFLRFRESQPKALVVLAEREAATVAILGDDVLLRRVQCEFIWASVGWWKMESWWLVDQVDHQVWYEHQGIGCIMYIHVHMHVWRILIVCPNHFVWSDSLQSSCWKIDPTEDEITSGSDKTRATKVTFEEAAGFSSFCEAERIAGRFLGSDNVFLGL